MRTEITPPATPPSDLMPLDDRYLRLGITAFVTLSLSGLALLSLLTLFTTFLERIGLGIFALLFAASYLRSRNAKSPDTSVYLFILTAPVAINMLCSLLVPLYSSVLTGLVGVVLAYVTLSTKDLL
jgi:hypothetical protein